MVVMNRLDTIRVHNQTFLAAGVQVVNVPGLR